MQRLEMKSTAHSNQMEQCMHVHRIHQPCHLHACIHSEPSMHAITCTRAMTKGVVQGPRPKYLNRY
uniref:Uncharacterized protein n=1 Tax=Triticum urartu TaxID=4572 RepID=A0A8R7URP1_TRIUA